MTDFADFDERFPPRILVIDDEERIRDACRIILADEGFDVSAASDGDTGLKKIEAEHYDIILLDLMMPGISGFDVLAKVRSLHPDTVVIVITGYATVEHSIEAMKKGAFDFIPKPFTPEQLRVVTHKAIRHNRALQDIAETKSRLRVMVNRLSDGVMTTDTQKRVVLANPAFLQMIGHQGTEAVGSDVSEIVTQTPLLGLIDQTLAMPENEFRELTEEFGGDETDDRVFSAVCTPFRNRTGLNIGTITVLRDITALKKMDQMKSDFVSMVSHEIRSPMNSIQMQIKIILDGLAGDTTEKQKEILNRASGKIGNLVNMASELLDLARIESGLISQEKEALNLADILTDQVSFHRDEAEKAGCPLKLEIGDADLPAVVNRQNIEEVLANLITNAIKYSPQGGPVTVGAKKSGGYAVIRVSDSGLGMSEEDVEKIFTRFYRVKNEQTRYIHGTGLGLPIVKSIVEAHRGNIRVESRPGEGSAFTVCLPLGDA